MISSGAQPSIRACFNRFRDPGWRPSNAIADVLPFHRTLAGYMPTPLLALPALARALGLGSVWVKDESWRFGIKSFKALGASYAIHCLLKHLSARRTFAAATDGNHGRAVAWTAQRLGHRAVIYVPSNTSSFRIEAIRAFDAEVVIIDGTYDEAVARCAETARREGWQIVSDTSYDDDLTVPRWITDGYSTMYAEIEAQRPQAPWTCILIQGGVGALAQSTVEWTRARGGKPTSLIVVEPTDADCLLESAASPDGSIQHTRGKVNSLMAGLNAGTPSRLAWPALRAGVDYFLAIDDAFAVEAMKRLAYPASDPVIVAGESGAAGLAGLLALTGDPRLRADRHRLGLDERAEVLIVMSEGDTDPVSYRSLIGSGPGLKE